MRFLIKEIYLFPLSFIGKDKSDMSNHTQTPLKISKEDLSLKQNKKTFVSYIDDKGEEVSGKFDSATVIQGGVLVIKTGRNTIKVPPHRWNKTKEEDYD